MPRTEISTFRKNDEPKGTTGTYFMGGVSAGWSQVLGRHLFLEAGLRLGYRSADGGALYHAERS